MGDDKSIEESGSTIADEGSVPWWKRHKMWLVICGVVLFATVAIAIGASDASKMVNTSDVDNVMNGADESGSDGGWGRGGHTGSGLSDSSSSGGDAQSSAPTASQTTTSVSDGDGAGGEMQIVARKVKRGAELELNTDRFDDASAELDKSLSEAGATVLSDETTQGSYWDKNKAEHLVRVVYAEMPSDNVNTFVNMCSSSHVMVVASRHVTMNDVTEDYEDQMETSTNSLKETERQLEEARKRLDASTDETERGRLEKTIASLEQRKSDIEKEISSVDEAVDMANVSLVLSGPANSADTVESKRQELGDLVGSIPDTLAIAGLSFIIGLIRIAPVIVVAALVGLGWWGFRKWSSKKGE